MDTKEKLEKVIQNKMEKKLKKLILEKICEGQIKNI